MCFFFIEKKKFNSLTDYIHTKVILIKATLFNFEFVVEIDKKCRWVSIPTDKNTDRKKLR